MVGLVGLLKGIVLIYVKKYIEEEAFIKEDSSYATI